MRVKIKDIIALEKFKPAFSKLYAEGEIPDEDLAARQAEAAKVKEKKAELKKQKAELRQQKQIAAASSKERRDSCSESAMQM